MELRTDWLARPADDDLRRSFAEPELDESDWEPITVPGHWRSTPAFADVEGPLLHRTRFEQEPGAADRRWWLRFDGLFYEGDIWLDGSYVGTTEGYFFSHSFEVTDALRARSEHVLAVEAACATPAGPNGKRALTGSFQRGDLVEADWNPGGIWRPVHLEDSGPVRIRHLVTRCIRADANRAVLAFTADLDAAEAVDAHLRTTVGGVDSGADRPLAAGINTVEWTVTVDRPRLWWPRALGDAALEATTVEVRLRDAAGSRVSDRRRFRTGLRQVAMKRWILSVNGERLFAKGTHLPPASQALGHASVDALRADVDAVADAGLDLIRMSGHVGRPETYEAADEAGLLIWQDFPLVGTYARSVRKQAVRQAREMVAALAHHPSVALWCGHDRPAPARDDASRPNGLAAALTQQVPSWNRTVLDRAVARSIERADGTRPVIRHSGVAPRWPLFESTDSQIFAGWTSPSVRDLGGLARALPARVRFVSALGAQSVPVTDAVPRGPGPWPDLDGAALTRDGTDVDALLARSPIGAHSIESWAAATREVQAEVVRRSIEQLRRLKYRPTGGFAQLAFLDARPAVSWGVLDHERRPKAAHAALVAACRAVIVVADLWPERVAVGDAVALDVHVVSDRRLDLSGWVDAELTWTGDSGDVGRHVWRFRGDVAADAVARVGTVQFEVPAATGELTLTLRAQVGDEQADNVYRTIIDRASIDRASIDRASIDSSPNDGSAGHPGPGAA